MGQWVTFPTDAGEQLQGSHFYNANAVSYHLLTAPQGPRRQPPVARTHCPAPRPSPGQGGLGERGGCRTDSRLDASDPVAFAVACVSRGCQRGTPHPGRFGPQLDSLRPSGAGGRRSRVARGEPQRLWAEGSLGLPPLCLHRRSPCLRLHSAFPVGPSASLPRVPVTRVQRGSLGSDPEWDMEGAGLSGRPCGGAGRLPAEVVLRKTHGALERFGAGWPSELRGGGRWLGPSTCLTGHPMPCALGGLSLWLRPSLP